MLPPLPPSLIPAKGFGILVILEYPGMVANPSKKVQVMAQVGFGGGRVHSLGLVPKEGGGNSAHEPGEETRRGQAGTGLNFLCHVKKRAQFIDCLYITT